MWIHREFLLIRDKKKVFERKLYVLGHKVKFRDKMSNRDYIDFRGEKQEEIEKRLSDWIFNLKKIVEELTVEAKEGINDESEKFDESEKLDSPPPNPKKIQKENWSLKKKK